MVLDRVGVQVSLVDPSVPVLQLDDPDDLVFEVAPEHFDLLFEVLQLTHVLALYLELRVILG